MSFPSISIIILNYNAKDFIENCIRSVVESEYPSEKMEIILVDNASSDKSVEIVRNKFPHVKIIQNKIDLGFSAGNNVGIHIATGEILVILNPDVTVEKNWLRELIKVFEQNNNVGLVRSKLLNPDGTIQNIGFKLHKSLRSIPIAPGEIDIGQYDNVGEVEQLDSNALAIKKTVLDDIGPYDPFIFMYGDGIDLCLRARAAGYRLFLAPHSVVYHYESYSWRKHQFKKIFLFEKNRLYLIQKHYRGLERFERMVISDIQFHIYKASQLLKGKAVIHMRATQTVEKKGVFSLLIKTLIAEFCAYMWLLFSRTNI